MKIQNYCRSKSIVISIRNILLLCMTYYLVCNYISGAANYTEFGPDHSYINVQDFESPKALAEYLKYLDRNPEEYLSYFWWKDYFKVKVFIHIKFPDCICLFKSKEK